MTDAIDVATIRDEALRKLGRNVVNFQKIEACLKRLLLVSNIQGSPNALVTAQRAKEARIRKKPLGYLANASHRDVSGPEAQSAVPEDLSEIWMSISFNVEADADAVKRRKRALSALVAERNNLIHRDLTHFDHNSAQSCRDLIAVLDPQNVRILQQLGELGTLLDIYKAGFAELKSWIDSDDFLRQLQTAVDDT